jgi:enoyl-CoA hydratase/carnithine racemase
MKRCDVWLDARQAGIITLNRPKRLNALNNQLWTSWAAHWLRRRRQHRLHHFDQ